MKKILTAKNVRLLEQRAEQYGHRLDALMYKAGTRAAEWIWNQYADIPGRVLILCGKGNNGGDGFVAAHFFSDHDREVDLLCVDGMPVTELAIEAMRALDGNARIHFIEDVPPFPEPYAFVIDAVYGIGFRGALSAHVSAVFQQINRWNVPRIALDLPSGTNCDLCDVDPASFQADHTLTFMCFKPVHLHAPSDAYCGTVEMIDLDIPKGIYDEIPEYARLLERKDIARMLPARKAESNKGTYGRALCICGSYGMAGAAAFSSMGALRSGCGLVQLAVPDSIYPVLASNLWEPVYLPLPEEDGKAAFSALSALQSAIAQSKAVLIGCGWGISDGTKALLSSLMQITTCPMVIDADGINILSLHKDLLHKTSAPVVLTPHPGEMARLTGKTIADIQSNRVETARAFAIEYGVIVVLKGHHTVIAAPDGAVCISTTGNNGMAKGGSGDLLAGMAVSLLTQQIPPFDAACAAVYLHGAAGDLCAEKLSVRSMQPSDMVQFISAAFQQTESEGVIS